MSYETWCEEFYSPIPEEIDGYHAILHSFRKWIGFKEENLKKHDILKLRARQLPAKSQHCALCKLYLSTTNCAACPLYKINGNVRCDIMNAAGLNLYASFSANNEPSLMIDGLRRALVSNLPPVVEDFINAGLNDSMDDNDIPLDVNWNKHNLTAECLLFCAEYCESRQSGKFDWYPTREFYVNDYLLIDIRERD